MIEKNAKIYIAGHRGLVGSAILKNLQQKGYTNFVLRTHKELDLTNQNAVASFFEEEKPEYVILAAAKVGGIVANNTYRGQFIYENLMIQNNVIHQSFLHNVKKLVFLGSTCIYPRDATQPMDESVLLTGELEYTNEPYAIAKIAGIKMCESYNIQYGTNFIAVMPTNLYGPNDNFDLETSHVLPAIVRKMHLAKCLSNEDWQSIRIDINARPIEDIDDKADNNAIIAILNKYGIILDKKTKEVTVQLWGSGKPMREFLWSEEMADATTFIMESINFLDVANVIRGDEVRNTHINVGTGNEISIEDLATLTKEIVGFDGSLEFNTNKLDGTMRKLTNVDKLNQLGWKSQIRIKEGIGKIYRWYIQYTLD